MYLIRYSPVKKAHLSDKPTALYYTNLHFALYTYIYSYWITLPRFLFL